MRGQRRMARQTPPGARPNRGAMGWLGPHPGVLLESCGDAGSRGMVVHDRTRLSGRLRHCRWPDPPDRNRLAHSSPGPAWSRPVRSRKTLAGIRLLPGAGCFFDSTRVLLDLRKPVRSVSDSSRCSRLCWIGAFPECLPAPPVNISRNNTSHTVLKQECEDCCKILIPLTKFPDFVLDSPQGQV